MLALETRSDALGLELTKQCFAHGLLAIFAFNRQSALQVMPPLTIGPRRSTRCSSGSSAAVAALPQ